MTNDLISRIRQLTETKETVIVAIDGRCGAGKTTLASMLSQMFDCTVIHMDDFFLSKEKRTPDRLNTPGGNFDKERFLDEVLIPLASGDSFSYRPYICSISDFGDEIAVDARGLVIIEGSYSCHPEFWEYYDLRVFVNIDSKTQKERISARNPDKADMFFDMWIPLEEEYFKAFSIKERSDLIIDTTK